MANTYFQFKEFRIEQALSGMKVTTDACLFGAWVAEVVATLNTKRILDIGTGTGLLSLMLAQKIGNAKIDAVEVNEQAYNEALLNFQNSSWSNRLTCTNSSIQNFVGDAYDLIICNPPFFEGSKKGKSKDKNDAVHSSLLSKKELLEAVLRFLSHDGVCYLLYPEQEMLEFINLAKPYGLMVNQVVEVRNEAEQSVFRLMAVFSMKPRKININQLNIRESSGIYTPQFWSLLDKYYLEYNNPNLK